MTRNTIYIDGCWFIKICSISLCAEPFSQWQCVQSSDDECQMELLILGLAKKKHILNAVGKKHLIFLSLTLLNRKIQFILKVRDRNHWINYAVVNIASLYSVSKDVYAVVFNENIEWLCSRNNLVLNFFWSNCMNAKWFRIKESWILFIPHLKNLN